MQIGLPAPTALLLVVEVVLLPEPERKRESSASPLFFPLLRSIPSPFIGLVIIIESLSVLFERPFHPDASLPTKG